MDDLQFYPTPQWLARFAYSKFKTPVQHLLDSSAGKGDLLIGAGLIKDGYGYNRSASGISAVEIDPDNQATLRGNGITVVGHDFLKMQSAKVYSHILMNPPFSGGIDHVLHAWNILGSGEVSAIINAETIRNPFSKKRKLLLKLIEDHGSVTLIDDAFAKENGVKRSADVDIAVVYLRKKGEDFNFSFGCKEDEQGEIELDDSNSNSTAVGLPVSVIQSYVNVFNSAVKSLEFSTHAANAASKYAELLGVSVLQQISQEQARKSGDEDFKIDTCFSSSEEVRTAFSNGYSELKSRAWTSILRYSEIEKKLSSKNKERLFKEFENISKLEFTVENIHSFLLGFSYSRQELDNDMLLQVFDKISAYHPENRLYYKGWKSNGWHRLNAFQVKPKRFILPLSANFNYIDYEKIETIKDLDKAFCYLDGKQYSDTINGGHDVFNGIGNALKKISDNMLGRDHSSIGERITTEYFDFRLYLGAGTLHVFPRRKDLVDRLNRVVGKLRQWLPVDESEAAPEFWEQYDKAEKINNKMGKPASDSEVRVLDRFTKHYERMSTEERDYLIKIAKPAADKMIKRFSDSAEALGIDIEPAIAHDALLRLSHSA